MKLEEIKNMSDEEFIDYVNKYGSIYVKPTPEKTKTDIESCKKILNTFSVINGIAMGTIPYMFVDNFTDDSIVLGVVYIAGALIGMPVSKKLLKYLYVKLEKLSAEGTLSDLSKLKNNLEDLSDEKLKYLKSIDDNSDMHELHSNIKSIFGENCSSDFINDLDVTYVEEANELGYSKTMNKND